MVWRYFIIIATLLASMPALASETDDLRMAISAVRQQREQALDALAGAQVQIMKLTHERDAAKAASDPKPDKATAKILDDAKRAIEEGKKPPTPDTVAPAPDTKEK